MKHEAIAVLILGYDKSLLETRQWVLQTRGYKVIVAEGLSSIERLPSTRRVDLLLICHSVPERQRAIALARVNKRWPGVRHLTLTASQARIPDGILGQLLHTMDGPDKLISLVSAAMQDPQPQARAS